MLFALRQAKDSNLENEEEEEEDDDDDDDDDDDPPEVDVQNFKPPKLENTFGFGRGRSSPTQRKAMGRSGKSSAKVFMCTNCGSESIQWRGQCPTCQEWSTMQEFAVPRSTSSSSSSLNKPLFGSSSKPTSSSFGGGGGGGFGGGGVGSQSWLGGLDSSYTRPVSIKDVDLKSAEHRRIIIPDDDELNSVLGGGLMKGSLILLGGDPGVGKSTLALQLAGQVASLSTPPVGIGMGAVPTMGTTQGPVWYVSGEETLAQIATRAHRLHTTSDQLFLLAETNLNVLAEQVVDLINQQPLSNDNEQSLQALPPSLLIVDSIQTMMCEAGGSSSPGGISQVRESMALLLRLAKTTETPIIAIGHVTKSGEVAGPRMVEHMVDAVLYLESAMQTQYRWLRAQKNRFGSCQTVGLYEFAKGRLVPNPDLDGASTLPMDDLEGCAMAISVEGSHRAMTVEVQALVTLSSASFGKKTVDGGGISYARLNLLLGVLQKHCGVFIGKSRDVYVNVVGGSASNKQGAVALDLAVAIALTSSLASIPVRGDTAFLAQVGLLGELRSLSSMETRLLQAQRMGFSRVVVPGRQFKSRRLHGMEYIECPTLKQAMELGLTAAVPKRRKQKSNKTKQRSNKSVSPAPGSVDELELQDIIIDDEDDEDDYY